MTTHWRDRALLFASPILAFLAPLLHAYSTLKLPVGSHSLLLSGGIVLLSLLFGLAVATLQQPDRGNGTLEVLKAAVLGAAIVLVVDLSFYFADGPLLSLNNPLEVGVIAVAWAVLTAVLWLIRGQAPKILFIGAAALLVSAAAPQLLSAWSAVTGRSEREPRAEVSDAPPILYLVLDELIGPEGIPRALPGGEQAYQGVRELFEKHGFRLYGNAFSRHVLTARSIPNTINFDVSDDSWGMDVPHSEGSIVRSTLIEKLARARPLVVYQTDHMNFCSDVPVRCETLPSFDSESPYVAHLDLGFDARLQALRDAVAGSQTAVMIADLAAAALGFDLNAKDVPAYLDVHAFPAWFEQFADDVSASGGANSYFAHLLSPHAPYLLDASCVVQDRWELPYNLTEDAGLTGNELEAARMRNYGWYFEQMGCLLRSLEALLTRIDQTPGFENATLVLHGDHGSRISAGRFVETVSDRDMVDNHSALYAIRGPGIEHGYDHRVVSVQRLTAEYFSGRSAAEIGPDTDLVVLDSMAGEEAVLRQMPPLPLN